MKTNIFLTFCCLVVAWTMHAQSVVKVNPLGLAFGTFNAGYEQIFSEKTSIYIGGNLIFKDISGIRYSGGGMGAQFRYYQPEGEIPEGLFYGPLASVSFISFDAFDQDNGYALIQLGGLIGYQWVFWKQFTIEVGVGPTYGIATSNFLGIDVFGDGFVPNGFISVGMLLGD